MRPDASPIRVSPDAPDAPRCTPMHTICSCPDVPETSRYIPIQPRYVCPDAPDASRYIRIHPQRVLLVRASASPRGATRGQTGALRRSSPQAGCQAGRDAGRRAGTIAGGDTGGDRAAMNSAECAEGAAGRGFAGPEARPSWGAAQGRLAARTRGRANRQPRSARVDARAAARKEQQAVARGGVQPRSASPHHRRASARDVPRNATRCTACSRNNGSRPNARKSPRARER